ncbi:hypothetical protein JZ751_017298 [Albula glossodonta]|uniref:Secreted protein n=1 Tax=Albula glossodonta TaxID=121402 RepID=A0A8T2MVP1_9TELE|nr:hypothetical protein JZ751_017298 [Albula glossodonta]
MVGVLFHTVALVSGVARGVSHSPPTDPASPPNPHTVQLGEKYINQSCATDRGGVAEEPPRVPASPAFSARPAGNTALVFSFGLCCLFTEVLGDKNRESD